MSDRKAKLQDPQPACQKLLSQDYHLRKTKLLIRYSVVSADPADSPNSRSIPLSPGTGLSVGIFAWARL